MVFIPVLCGDIHSRSLSWYSFLYSVVIFIHMLFDIFIPMLSAGILKRQFVDHFKEYFRMNTTTEYWNNYCTIKEYGNEYHQRVFVRILPQSKGINTITH